MTEMHAPSASDVLSVKSRVSWGAITAGAMISLTIYMVLTLLGVAVGVEVAVRGGAARLGAGAAIYSIIALMLSMFFGGWAVSRLAVGETRLEAILYGVILWGVLFLGLLWMASAGMRTGFGAMVGMASGVYATEEGGVNVDRVAQDLKKAGVEDQTVEKYRTYLERVQRHPSAAGEVGREMSDDPEFRQMTAETRQATWWTVLGILGSLAVVVFGSLIGAGEVLQPVPFLGVKRIKPVVSR